MSNPPLLTEHTDATQYNPSTKNASEILPLMSPTKTSNNKIPLNKSFQLQHSNKHPKEMQSLGIQENALNEHSKKIKEELASGQTSLFYFIFGT